MVFYIVIVRYLQAVGVGSFSGSTAAASAAAIRWIFLFVFCIFNFCGIIRASYVQLLGFESRDLPKTRKQRTSSVQHFYV